MLRTDAEQVVLRPTVNPTSGPGRQPAEKPAWKSIVASTSNLPRSVRFGSSRIPSVHMRCCGMRCTARWRCRSGSRCRWRSCPAGSWCASSSSFMTAPMARISSLAARMTWSASSPASLTLLLTVIGVGNTRYITRSAGHLDRRGTGDVWTMTVQEYLGASRATAPAYRLARNPSGTLRVRAALPLPHQTAFCIPQSESPTTSLGLVDEPGAAVHGGMLMTDLRHRAVSADPVDRNNGRWRGGPLAILRAASIRRCILGTRRALGLHGSGAATAAPTTGCPRVLQWFSGNIGFHHIHHLSPRIPNYNLQRCHESEPLFQQVKPITLGVEPEMPDDFAYGTSRAEGWLGYAHMKQLRKEQHARAGGWQRASIQRATGGPEVTGAHR